MTPDDPWSDVIRHRDALVARLEWERDTARIIAIVFAIIAALGWVG